MTGTAAPATPGTIVLIHGLWMTPLAWEHWAARLALDWALDPRPGVLD